MGYFTNNKFLQLLFLVVGATVFSNKIFSQLIPGAPVYRDIKAYDDHLTITDNQGAPFKKNYSNIEGSPFFIEHYCLATLILNKGAEYQSILTKLDLYKHEIIVIDKDNKEIIAVGGLVINISLTDTIGGSPLNYNFRSGYPAIDKNNTFNYYQLLSDGKLQLLKHIRKEIVEQKNIQSGEIRKEFVSRDEYYTYSNGEIKKLKKEKEYFQDLMKDQEQKINEYLKNRKMNYKNIRMLTDLVNFYNSLEKPF